MKKLIIYKYALSMLPDGDIVTERYVYKDFRLVNMQRIRTRPFNPGDDLEKNLIEEFRNMETLPNSEEVDEL